MATRRIGLNGSSSHIAFDAEKRKISFPLLTTTNVCKEGSYRERVVQMLIDRTVIDSWIVSQFIGDCLPVHCCSMDRYPREEWRPIPAGSCPAIEQVLAHPVQVQDPVVDLHPRPRHHIGSVRRSSRDVRRFDVPTCVMNEQRTKELRTDILAKRLRGHPARHCTCTYRHTQRNIYAAWLVH